MNRTIIGGCTGLLLAIAGVAALAQPANESEPVREVARLKRAVLGVKQGTETIGQRLTPHQADVQKLEDKLKSINPPKLKSETSEKMESKTVQPPRQPGGPSASPPSPKKDASTEEWNLPLVRPGKKKQKILIVCQNDKAYYLDFESLSEARKKDGGLSMEKNVTYKLKQGDFDVKFSSKIDGNLVYISVEGVLKTGKVGEAAEAALATDSSLMKRLETLDPKDNTLQFVVYPDSYELFSKLRKFAYDKDYDVAWMPMTVEQKIRLGSGSASVQ